MDPAHTPLFFFTPPVGLMVGPVQPLGGYSLPAGNVFAGRYRYIGDLMALESCVPPTQPIQWPRGPTPVFIDRLLPYLSSHPDRLFVQYIHSGFTCGFHIGFDRHGSVLHTVTTNHPSSLANTTIVDNHISAESQVGRLVGPLPSILVPHVYPSPIGLVPKSHHTGKWRLIVDLSAPHGHSINDGIASSMCSLAYSSVDDAVKFILELGPGTQLVKLDLKDAYRMVPIHPNDQHLLAITWRGMTYIDRALPFGLRSAPKIFTAVADALAWALHCSGIDYQLHYLDDFLLLGRAGTTEGATVLSSALGVLQHLGVPVASQKIEGPSTTLTFLGILIDTRALELRLPEDKLLRLQLLIQRWSSKQSCTRKELESFLGHLSHAAIVVKPGRTFLRELFSRLKMARAPHHFVRLSSGAKADICWWRCFLQNWNGTSFFPRQSASCHVFSDASGNYGCGAFVQSMGWFQLKWPDNWGSVSIAVKELIPVVISAALWGACWTGKGVCFHSDNMSVVAVLKKGSSGDRLLMHLLRCLSFFSAYFKFQHFSEHVPGVMNTAADALSRDNLLLFFSLVPQTPQTHVPRSVAALLVTQMPDWGSHTWTDLFSCCLTEVSHRLPSPHTSQVNTVF